MLSGLLLKRWVNGHRFRCKLGLLEGTERQIRTCRGPLGRICLCWGRLSGLGRCWRGRIFGLHFVGSLLALVKLLCQNAARVCNLCSALYPYER
jgi:hypothetical protein